MVLDRNDGLGIRVGPDPFGVDDPNVDRYLAVDDQSGRVVTSADSFRPGSGETPRFAAPVDGEDVISGEEFGLDHTGARALTVTEVPDV